MFKAILIPLDGTKEGEAVLSKVSDDLAPGATVILLRILEPIKSHMVGGVLQNGHKAEMIEEQKAREYLDTLIGHLPEGPEYRGEVSQAESVAHGIVNFANHEHVELIAMYTHKRPPLLKAFQGSVAKEVKSRTKTTVKVYTPEGATA